MQLPAQPVTLTAEELADLNLRLANMRHNINNHLSLIVAAAELLRRRPEMTSRATDTLVSEPQKISDAIQQFSTDFEAAFGITRE